MAKQSEQCLKTEIIQPIKLGYLLYLPPDYNSTGEGSPMILFLHGAGERGDNLNQVKIHGLPKMLETDSNFPFIVVSPQCPAESWWTFHLEALKALIDDITARYNVDKSRIYLTGLSMGGFGTWTLAAVYPDYFAAIAPVCGGGEYIIAKHNRYRMPVWAFHGAKDDVIPLQRSQEMVDSVRSCGGNVEFTVYPELDHNCWDAAYANKDLYKWFLAHKRQEK